MSLICLKFPLGYLRRATNKLMMPTITPTSDGVSFAILAAIRRASSRVSSLAAESPNQKSRISEPEKANPKRDTLGVGCLTLGYLTERPRAVGGRGGSPACPMHVDGRPAAAKLNSPLVLSFYPLVQGKRQHSSAYELTPAASRYSLQSAARHSE
jgi:hypothetical protein